MVVGSADRQSQGNCTSIGQSESPDPKKWKGGWALEGSPIPSSDSIQSADHHEQCPLKVDSSADAAGMSFANPKSHAMPGTASPGVIITKHCLEGQKRALDVIWKDACPTFICDDIAFVT